MMSAAMDDAAVQARAKEIEERGFCVLPAQYDRKQVDWLREALAAEYEKLDRPPLYSKSPRTVAEDVELSSTGLVLTKLLKRRPDMHAHMLDEDVVRIAQAALGPGMHLELTGAVITDHTRPFFEWHDHLGGIDEELFRRRGERPRLPILQRLAMIVYLDEMHEGAGRLLVHPERRDDGKMPVDAPIGGAWPGQVAVEGPPGTTVLIDQTTWHAAMPRTVDEELRIFFGLWFAAKDVGETELSDESLYQVQGASALLEEILPKRTA